MSTFSFESESYEGHRGSENGDQVRISAGKVSDNYRIYTGLKGQLFPQSVYDSINPVLLKIFCVCKNYDFPNKSNGNNLYAKYN